MITPIFRKLSPLTTICLIIPKDLQPHKRTKSLLKVLLYSPLSIISSQIDQNQLLSRIIKLKLTKGLTLITVSQTLRTISLIVYTILTLIGEEVIILGNRKFLRKGNMKLTKGSKCLKYRQIS